MRTEEYQHFNMCFLRDDFILKPFYSSRSLCFSDTSNMFRRQVDSKLSEI